MRTIWDEASRRSLLERLARLTPEHRAQWGKMNAAQMVRHCAIGVGMLLGEQKVASRRTPLRLAPLRYLIIHVLPWPKGAPTAPELVTTAYQGDLDKDIAALRRTLELLVARGEHGRFEEHAAFGPLTGKSVGVLVWRHLDHHLRQFGLT